MKKFVKLIAFLILVGLGYGIFMYGFPLSNIVGVYDIEPLKDTISYGLDLTGGVNVVLEAKESNNSKVTEETLDKAVETIRTRIDSLGVKEPTISKQGTNRIRVQIPDIEDQQEALDMIGKTANLEFKDPKGKVILNGSNVKSASYEMQKTEYVEEPVVSLEFDDKGREAFAEATSDNIGKAISIELDNEVISAPTVQVAITDGKCVITGMESSEAASKLATLIKAGSLPVELEAVETRTIGPSLGQNSLDKALYAGMIGVGLVLIFMLIMYLLPGFIADIALITYILIYLIIMSTLNVTLTLSGIAGIILSIGMAVDSNVIIFERIREELYAGRSLKSAINAGFSRAFLTIIDSNITTVIAGLVLFFMGSGTIKGFALTLIIGVIVSLFTAVFITRWLMKLVSSIKGFDNLRLYNINPNDVIKIGGEKNEN